MRLVQSRDICVICNFYGPHDVGSRAHMFAKIGAVLDEVVGRVVVGWDFNTILNVGERRGGGVNTVGD